MEKRGLLETSALTPPPASPATGNNPALSQLGPSPQAPTEDAEPNVTPEEQEEYEMVVDNAYKLLYSNVETTLENMSQGDIVTGMANTVANVFSRISDTAKRDGVKFTDGVLLAAAGEIMEDMADLVTETGIDEPTPEQMESAMYGAVEQYREMQQKNVNPEEAVGEFMQLRDAEKNGTLEELAPGVSERFAQFVPSPEEAEAAGQQAPATAGPPQPKRGLAE
tara:strand:+ start:217 stop:885 length:669 start_codon:yes stop_codon:yes gene_type:complete